LTARRNNIVLTASEGHVTEFDLDRGEPRVDFTPSDASGTGPGYSAADGDQDFYAEGRGGRITQGRVGTGVHIKNADCTFSGIFTGFAKSGPVDLAKRIKADAGERVTLFKNDDFRVTGRCQDNGGGDLSANTFLAARGDNLLYFASNVGEREDLDFDRSDGALDFVNAGLNANGTDPSFMADDYYQYFYAEGKGGRITHGRVGTGVHIKNADCTFSGIFRGPKRGGPLHLIKRIKADAGERVTLFKDGDFRVTGDCQDNGGGDFTANTFLAARRDNLLYFGSDLSGGDLDFDSGDPKVDFTSYDATGATPDFAGWEYYNDFYAEGKGGAVLNGQLATGVHVKGADCTFAGIFLG
jgi:hypothetical protein